MLLRFGQPGLSVQSPAFAEGHYIPLKYSCDGDNVSPPFVISHIPKGTKSLAMIVEDIESPNGPFTHWVMWNIAPVEKISENSAPGVQGKNSNQTAKYYGPCPPNGVHLYHFRLYALDKMLQLPEGSDVSALRSAMVGHMLGASTLSARYKSRKD